MSVNPWFLLIAVLAAGYVVVGLRDDSRSLLHRRIFAAWAALVAVVAVVLAIL